MQTTIRIKASEIPDLVDILKLLFKKEKEVEVTVSTPLPLAKKETKEEYWAKLEKRLKNIDEGKNLVTFTGEEFTNFVAEQKEKYGKKR